MNTTELKFLVDVGVGKGIENFLSEAGYDTKAVREINPCLEDEEQSMDITNRSIRKRQWP